MKNLMLTFLGLMLLCCTTSPLLAKERPQNAQQYKQHHKAQSHKQHKVNKQYRKKYYADRHYDHKKYQHKRKHRHHNRHVRKHNHAYHGQHRNNYRHVNKHYHYRGCGHYYNRHAWVAYDNHYYHHKHHFDALLGLILLDAIID